jgi:lauroyl/myristoyl acyltransferase
MRLSSQGLQELPAVIQATGEENVAAALRGGRGLLLTVAHSGTWWHAPLYLAARGHRLRAVVNPGLPPRVGEYLQTISDRFGIPVTYVGQDAYQTARETFSRNEIFVIAIDRSLRVDRSVGVPCGPATILLDPGPAILALRQRVPVVHAETFHDEKGRSWVNYSPPLTFGPGTAMTTTDSVLRFWGQSIFEQWQRHPEQWWTLSFCSLRAPTDLTSAPQTQRS